VSARVRINDADETAATGVSVLSHPFNSLVWLPGKLVQFGERLRAGDYVMTGSFTRQFPLHAGDRVETDFAGIGAVAVSLA
jgi:2-keto-4-pentenoate hydratase